MSDPFELTDPTPAPAALDAPAPRHTPYLDGLNKAQRQAVEAVEGPVLVLAGAGTGKTRVLTTRLAHILTGHRARPWEILSVTFTNKAAREMKDRVGALIGMPVEGWWVGTFHALGARILRSHAEAVGLKSNFTILDDDDQVRLLKQFLAAHGVDEKRNPARQMLGVIQRWKDRGLMPDKVSGAEGSDAADGKLVTIYREYQERLATLNATDFGDLLLLCLELFKREPEILAHYQRQFRYILVDEYQDTNVAQYLWLRLLAQGHKNICCVGDDDQSIYSWRGAEVGNILRFEKDFPGATVIKLERNYRSTAHILAAAAGLIAHNQGRLGKTLFPDDAEAKAEKVRVMAVWDGEEEARRVVDEADRRRRLGESLNTMAVLVRAGFQTREFEERLITIGLPYRVVGGQRFYERLEIRDAVAYLRVVQSPDDDLALERVINNPPRGIGKTTLQGLHITARSSGLSLWQAARLLTETDELKPKARGAIAGILADFERWREQALTLPPDELAEIVLDESGYTDKWRADRSPEAPGRLENLKELVNGLQDFEALGDFLEHVSLVMDNDARDDEDKISLMTLHGAKGLEFDTVFLPGWEEGLFPHQRALDETGLNGLEEERRLAYVGITRAKRRAIISHAASRRIYNQWQSAMPSRFLAELPAEHVEKAGERDQRRDHGLGGFGRMGDARQGWGQAQSRVRQPKLVEAETWDVQISEAGNSRYKPGERVFHNKFGYGKVMTADGNKLEIAFDKAGRKKVVDSFVQKA